MKALVISDSHGKIVNAVKVIDYIGDKIDAVIHLGDYIEDAYELERAYKSKEFFYVSGNCDYGAMEPNEKLIELEGKRIFLTHGHRYGVKESYFRLSYAAEEKGADICLYGHTHCPIIATVEKTIIMNPGSISCPRGISVCSYGIIDITDAVITPSVVGIYRNEYKVMNF